MEYNEMRELRRYVKAFVLELARPEELDLHNSTVEQEGGRFLWSKDSIKELIESGKSRARIAVERKRIANRVLALRTKLEGIVFQRTIAGGGMDLYTTLQRL